MTTEPQTNSLSGSVLPQMASHELPLQVAPHQVKPKVGSSARQTRERLVLGSMALVTAAAAALLYVLFEFSMASSVLAGGCVWAILITAHTQIKKDAEIARLKFEVQRLEVMRSAVADDIGSAGYAATDLQTPNLDAGKQRAAIARRAANIGMIAPLTTDGSGRTAPHAASPTGPQSQPRWEAAPARGPRASLRTVAGAALPAQPFAGGDAGRGAASGVAPPVETALWPGTSLSTADPMRDQWAFRPRETAEDQAAAQAAVAGAGSRALEDASDMVKAPASIDVDLEMVQRKIKALADEVNAAELSRDRNPLASVSASSALEKSIGELKVTAKTMRGPATAEISSDPPPPYKPAPQSQPQLAQASSSSDAMPFELLIPATAERIAISNPGADHRAAAPVRNEQMLAPTAELPPLPMFEFASVPAPSPRLASIIAAVENGAMDVFLSPIVALQSHQVSHYDVTVRLKAVSGDYIDNAEQELQLAGSDVLALFDTARLKRAALLAQRLDAHNKSGSLLSDVNGPSITNAEFLETFARVFEERDRISNQLVLTFSQTDIEQFSPSAWQALSDMHAFGFRFALSAIDHVAMDFAALAKRGFAFLKLEASALINGLPARDRFIGPDELCQYLAGAGMTLVAETIDDEAIRARVFGFGVLFGQGRLFGGARQVKLDPIPDGSSAAA